VHAGPGALRAEALGGYARRRWRGGTETRRARPPAARARGLVVLRRRGGRPPCPRGRGSLRPGQQAGGEWQASSSGRAGAVIHGRLRVRGPRGGASHPSSARGEQARPSGEQARLSPWGVGRYSAAPASPSPSRQAPEADGDVHAPVPGSWPPGASAKCTCGSGGEGARGASPGRLPSCRVGSCRTAGRRLRGELRLQRRALGCRACRTGHVSVCLRLHEQRERPARSRGGVAQVREPRRARRAPAPPAGALRRSVHASLPSSGRSHGAATPSRTRSSAPAGSDAKSRRPCRHGQVESTMRGMASSSSAIRAARDLGLRELHRREGPPRARRSGARTQLGVEEPRLAATRAWSCYYSGTNRSRCAPPPSPSRPPAAEPPHRGPGVVAKLLPYVGVTRRVLLALAFSLTQGRVHGLPLS